MKILETPRDLVQWTADCSKDAESGTPCALILIEVAYASFGRNRVISHSYEERLSEQEAEFISDVVTTLHETTVLLPEPFILTSPVYSPTEADREACAREIGSVVKKFLSDRQANREAPGSTENSYLMSVANYLDKIVVVSLVGNHTGKGRTQLEPNQVYIQYVQFRRKGPPRGRKARQRTS